MAADFDRWTKAVGDAANLRATHNIVRQQLAALINQRDQLFFTAGPNSPAYQNAQAQVETKSREEATFTPRIEVADADALFYEPSVQEKQQRYCADAARARTMPGINPTTQAALDARCRQAGGDPMVAPMAMGAPPMGEAPPAPAAAPPLPIVPILIVAAAAAGGLYFWSMRRPA